MIYVYVFGRIQSAPTEKTSKSFQMHLEHQPAGEVTAAVQFHHGVDVVFPKRVFHAEVDRLAVILCHQVDAVHGFVDEGGFGQGEAKISGLPLPSARSDGFTISKL